MRQPNPTTSPEPPEPLEVDDPEVRLYPQLTRFYGLSFEQLFNMPRPVVRLYAESMIGIIAQEQLLAIEAASFPHMEKDATRKTIRHWERKSKTYAEEEEPAPTEVNIEALLAMGIAVEESA